MRRVASVSACKPAATRSSRGILAAENQHITSRVASFTGAHRLHHKREFDLVYRSGQRLGDAFFQFVTRPNSLSHARLGLSIPAKAVGNAVNRNRIKRLVRESFRQSSSRLPASDIVVNARTGARGASSADLSRSLTQLWDKLARYE